MEAPLFGQKMRHDVAAGDDVEDVALAPALFQAAVGVVVVVVVLLQVGVVLRAEGHRRRKGVDEDILPFQSGQLPVDPGSQKVRHHRTAAVAAHPELDDAQLSLLLSCRQIVLQIGKHLMHRDDEAAVGVARAGVQIAHPLAAVAAAAQDERHDGGALPVQGDGLAGRGPAHEVARPAHIDIIIAVFHVAEAQLGIGCVEAVLTTHVPVGPVFRIAGPCIESSRHHAQRRQRQLVVVLDGAVRKKTVAVVIFVLDVHLAQLAAEGHCIIARRDCPAHRLAFCRCLSPGQYQPGRKSCTANQRFTEITSFHGLSPLLLS